MSEEKISDNEKQENSNVEEHLELELWDPSAAAWWALVFTPIFSTWLMQKNWQAIGNENEAKKAWYWIAGILICCLVLPFTNYTGSVALPILIIWYFGYAKKQLDYVKNNLQDKYKRKSWGKALLVGAGVLAVLLGINITVMLISDGSSSRIEQAAMQIVNEKILPQTKSHSGNNYMECVEITLGDEFANNNYYATAVFNDGSKARLTIQIKGEDMIVQINKVLKE